MNSEFISRLKSKQLQDTKAFGIIQKLLSIGLFLCQIVFFALYFLGFVSLFGRKLSVFGAINFVLDIFSAMTLRHFICATVGVIYIVLLVNIIKNIIFSITHFRKTLNGPREQDTMTAFVYLLNCFGSVFSSTVLMLVLASIADEITLSASAVFLIVFGCIISLIARFAMNIWKDGRILKCLYELLINTLFYMAVALTVLFVCRINVQNIISEFLYVMDLLGRASRYSNQEIVSAVFKGLGLPIFYIIMQIFAIKLAKGSLVAVKYQDGKVYAKRLMITALTFIGVVIAVELFKEGGFDGIEFIKNYISVTASAIAVFAAFFFPSSEQFSVISQAVNEDALTEEECKEEHIEDKSEEDVSKE